MLNRQEKCLIWVKIHMLVSTQILCTFPPGTVLGAPSAKQRGSSPGACGLCCAIGAWHSSLEGCCQSSIWRERETGLLSGLSSKASGHVYSEPDITLEEEVGGGTGRGLYPKSPSLEEQPHPPKETLSL